MHTVAVRATDLVRWPIGADPSGIEHGWEDMERLKVMIAGTERLTIRALRAQLEKRPDVVVIADAVSGAAALALLESTDPDIVFLDMQTPHSDACRLLEELSSRSPSPVIFLTARGDHAIHAYEVQAVDYRLIAREPTSLDSVLARVRHRAAQTLVARLEQAVAGIEASAGAGGQACARRLLVRRGSRARFVLTSDIEWIEAVGNHVRLHAGADSHLMHAPISELERKLDANQFLRIHRSTIVNLDRIAHIEPCGASDYQVVLLDGTELRVSRSSRDRLLKNTL